MQNFAMHCCIRIQVSNMLFRTDLQRDVTDDYTHDRFIKRSSDSISGESEMKILGQFSLVFNLEYKSHVMERVTGQYFLGAFIYYYAFVYIDTYLQ